MLVLLLLKYINQIYTWQSSKFREMENILYMFTMYFIIIIEIKFL